MANNLHTTQKSLSVGLTTYLAEYYEEKFSVNTTSILSIAGHDLQLVEGVILVAFLILRLSALNPRLAHKLALILLIVHHLIHYIGVKSTFLDCPALTFSCPTQSPTYRTNAS